MECSGVEWSGVEWSGGRRRREQEGAGGSRKDRRKERRKEGARTEGRKEGRKARWEEVKRRTFAKGRRKCLSFHREENWRPNPIVFFLQNWIGKEIQLRLFLQCWVGSWTDGTAWADPDISRALGRFHLVQFVCHFRKQPMGCGRRKCPVADRSLPITRPVMCLTTWWSSIKLKGIIINGNGNGIIPKTKAARVDRRRRHAPAHERMLAHTRIPTRTHTHTHTHTHTLYESLCGSNEHVWDIQQQTDCVSDIPV